MATSYTGNLFHHLHLNRIILIQSDLQFIQVDRLCVKDYVYDSGNKFQFKVEKGTPFIIPIYGMLFYNIFIRISSLLYLDVQLYIQPVEYL